MQLDHLAVSGATLHEARTHVEDALGVNMQPGGEHDVFHTHNALMGLEDGLYLEAIAINPDAPQPDRPRWFALDDFEGAARLTNWICRTDDLKADMHNLPASMGTPVALQRGDLRWRMVVPKTGHLPFDNLCAALIKWDTPLHPATAMVQTGCRLRRLTLTHPDADALKATLDKVMRDDLIAIETGAVAMQAEFSTPHGPRNL
ncbi:VOC family protein [Ascidiaceihabitans sp.]|uniref:VOC family protein n=1 Tax=Ascidiaceihabitans sp. TaxID=1872644 RepID=UPI003298729C